MRYQGPATDTRREVTRKISSATGERNRQLPCRRTQYQKGYGIWGLPLSPEKLKNLRHVLENSKGNATKRNWELRIVLPSQVTRVALTRISCLVETCPGVISLSGNGIE